MKTDDLFGAALLLLLTAILGVLAFHAIPPANAQLFTALSSGVVGAGVGTWIGFRWGSSKSSQAKDATIATLAQSPSQPGDQP